MEEIIKSLKTVRIGNTSLGAIAFVVDYHPSTKGVYCDKVILLDNLPCRVIGICTDEN